MQTVQVSKRDPVRTHRAADSIVLLRQAPLRAEYANAPQGALIAKRVATVNDERADSLHGTVAFAYEGSSFRYGIDRAVGGLHDAPNPGEMLCAALAACADASLRMVADSLRIVLTRLEVEVTGQVDVRGCLGLAPNVPVGFQSLSCHVTIGAEPAIDVAALEKLLAHAERSCINLATLRSGVSVRVTHAIDGAVTGAHAR